MNDLKKIIEYIRTGVTYNDSEIRGKEGLRCIETLQALQKSHETSPEYWFYEKTSYIWPFIAEKVDTETATMLSEKGFVKVRLFVEEKK